MKVNKKRLQAYVSLSIYESLKLKAESRGISLSELVSETLQTQSVSSSHSEISVDSDLYITKEQLRTVLEDFRREIERQMIREINKAELQWESNANTLVAMNSSMVELMASPGSMENALAKLKKRKK